MSTKFGVDSSSRFPFTARTYRQTDTLSQMPLITLPTAWLLLAWVTSEIYKHSYLCLQCFDAVSWVAGRASSL